MGRRKIRGDGGTVVIPHVIPVTVADLERAQQLMQQGFEWNASLPEGAKTELDQSPLPRFLQAGINLIREYCGADEEKFSSLATRVLALVRVVHSDKMARWVASPSDGATAGNWHPAILDVAASLPIRASGNFDISLFRDEVRNLARTKYPATENAQRQTGE